MAREKKPRKKTATSRTTTIDATEFEDGESEQPIGDDMTLIRRRIMYADAARRGKKSPTRKKGARRRKTK